MMKLLFEEHGKVDYNNYKFPYCVYCISENTDGYSDIYDMGFLPYTNNLEESRDIFYLARSIRIPLGEHSFKSKQKNILNKISKIYTDDLMQYEIVNKQVLINDASFHDWCIRNARKGFLHEERLNYILSRPYLQDILRISYEGKLLSYIFLVHRQKDFAHYWYSFYDLEIDLNDFGKWIFMKSIDWAQKQGYQYFYLGTCYAMNAFYKLSLSPATYFFDGEGWKTDIDGLKKRLLTETK